MTDLWTSASMHAPADVYQERLDAAIDAVSAALAPKFAFVSEATTKASFNDRLDIVARDVEKVVSAVTRRDEALFAPVHEAVISQWEQDFDVIVAARQSESQRTGNKRGWFRKQRRAEKVTKQAAPGDLIYTPGAPSYFIADFDKMTKAIEEGGWVNTDSEGFRSIDPAAPEDVVRIYQDLLSRGYANSYFASKKMAITAAEASHLLDDLDPAVTARLQPFVSYSVYGPEYHRGITENLLDAVRMARGGRTKEYEYILSRLDAHKDIQETGVNNWYYDNAAGKYQQRLDGTMGSTRFQAVASRDDPDLNRIRQTAGLYDDGFRDGSYDSQMGQGKTFGISTDQQILDSYGLGPEYLRGYKDGWFNGGTSGTPKTAYNDEFWATQNAHADEPHGFVEDTTFAGSHPQDGGRCGICGQPYEYELHTRTTNAPSGAAAVASMRKGAPFAGYADFDECVRKNADKGDPNAYCGEIMHRVEDGKKSSKTAVEELSVGQRVRVYNGHVPVRGVITEGLHQTAVEMVFGNGEGYGMVYTVKADDGSEREWSQLIVVAEEDFNRAWHVYDSSGNVVAGGPGISQARAEEMATNGDSLISAPGPLSARQGSMSLLKPLAFEAALSLIKTTNDPAVLLRMLAGNAKRREELIDVVLEASLNAQDEVARVRLEQLGVSASANDDLVDWDTYIKRINEDRKKTNTDGSPAPAAESEVIDWQDWARQGVLTHSFGSVALTLVREGSLIHWAVTDATGDEQKDAGSEPTVRDALEQAWDVLNKVLDKEPPPSDEIVQEVTDAAQATSDAVENAGGQTPEDAAATDGKPVADPDKAPVHPADPQPNDKKADPALEAKPSAPVDDTKTDPTDVKVDPDTKTADDPNAKPDPNDPTKVTKDPDAPPPDPDAKAADPNAKPADADPTKVDPDKPPSNDAPAQADGDTPAAPDDVVDSAEDKSMGDVLGIEPSTMDTGQTATMTYTLSDGTVGDTNVTFLREDNGIYFFDGPNGEFGLGDRDGEWVDSEGNSFAFSNGDAVEEITGEDDPSNGAQLEDIDLDAPAPAKNDGDSKPDFIKNKESAPADGKAPAKDDKEGDGKKKSQPPWLKTKKSMLEENPWMTDDMAERLAQRSASLAKTLTEAQIVRLRLLSEPCAACGAAPGQPCRTKIGDSLVPVDWTHTR